MQARWLIMLGACFLIGSVTQAQITWKHLDGPAGSSIHDVAVMQDGTLFVLNANGRGASRIMRSTDDGQSWETVLEVDSIALNTLDIIVFPTVQSTPGAPDDGQEDLYVGTPSGVFVSPDYGNSWRYYYAPALKKGGSIESNGDFTLISRGGAYSTDRGTVWDTIPPPPGAKPYAVDMRIRAHDHTVIATYYFEYGGNASEATNIYSTTDFGATWTKIGDEQTGNSPSIFIGTQGEYIACGMYGSKPAIATTDDGGANWTGQTGLLSHYLHYAAGFDGEQTVYVTWWQDSFNYDYRGFAYTTDLGTTWTADTTFPVAMNLPYSLYSGPREFAFDDLGRVYACTALGLFRSATGGNGVWERLFDLSGSQAAVNIAYPLKNNNLIVDLGIEGFAIGTKNGTDWQRMHLDTSKIQGMTYPTYVDEDVLYAMFRSDFNMLLHRSFDHGLSWERVGGIDSIRIVTSMAADTRGRLYASGYYWMVDIPVVPQLRVSADGGLTWNVLKPELQGGPDLRIDDDDYLFAGLLRTNLRTGSDWVDTYNHNGMYPKFSRSGLMAIRNNSKQIILISSDHGDTWTEKPYPFDRGAYDHLLDSQGSLYLLPHNAGSYYNPDAIEVWVSNDTGTTWTLQNTGLPASYCYNFSIDEDDFIYVPTWYGVYRSDQPVLSVGGMQAIADGFELRQNFPNPFNPTTTVQFTLSKSAHASLVVCDALGREVLRSDLGHRPAGTHSVTISLDHQPGGMYSYTLLADGKSRTRQMILLK